MKKIVNLVIVLLILSSCSLDENLKPTTTPRSNSFIDEEEILNEVVALRNDLFGQPTKSLAGITITPIIVPTKSSSSIIPYVVNYPNNEGYAVMATDGERIKTIAITPSGYLPPEIISNALGLPAILPTPTDSTLIGGEYEGDDPDDATYGDEHLEPYPLDVMPFIETEGGPGLVLSPDHPSVGLIVGALGEVGWTDDNMILNPDKPGIPTTPPPPVDSSLIGVWLNGYGVRPLIQTKWDQDSVYRQACPIMSNGIHAYAGCTAISVGQIVAYLAPPSLSYNWDVLTSFGHKDDLYGANATEAERVHVAAYVRDIADGVETEYGSGGSSSTRWRVKRFLKSIGFENVKIHNNWDMSKFKERIQDRLRYHLPIYIRGGRYNNDTDEKDWHAYIIDGFIQQKKYNTVYSYVTRTLYHINWGYSGSGDGYYNVDNWEQGKLAIDENIDSSSEISNCFNKRIRIITYKKPSWM